MKGKDKQRLELAMLKKRNMTESSSDDDDDEDIEKNFALLTKRGRGAKEWEQSQEEVEEPSGDDEEGSDGSTQEEEDEDTEGEESDGEEVEEEEVDEGDEDSVASDDEDDDDDEEEEEEEEGGPAADEDPDPQDAGGSSEIQTREDVKKELSTMSFEDIMKLQNKVGTKVYNEIAYGSKNTGEKPRKKRLNKNRPIEVSSKRPAPFLRQVVTVKKTTYRDPRFDDLSGEYKPEIFEKTYKFIDDIRGREKELVKKQLKKAKTMQRKEKLQFLLKRMDNQERARLSREQQRERELQFKRQQRERASQGARPFFLKKSEKKKLELAEKYQELKKSGKLENFLSKKRKRNAMKDRRKLPTQPQSKKAV